MKNIPVKSVKKALDLLSILVFEDLGNQGIELSVLAKRLGMPNNTAHNLLKTMAHCGFVAQTETSKYIAGPKCQQIGTINELKSSRNTKMLDAQIQKLSSDVQENIVYTILAGGRRITIIHCEPEEQLIKIDSSRVDLANSIYALPTGRVLTAYASETEFQDIVAYYGQPNASWPDFENDIAGIRKDGFYALTPDKPTINSYAVPVLNSQGNLLGAIGCYAPIFRCTEEHQRNIVDNLLKTAKTAGLILGKN